MALTHSKGNALSKTVSIKDPTAHTGDPLGLVQGTQQPGLLEGQNRGDWLLASHQYNSCRLRLTVPEKSLSPHQHSPTGQESTSNSPGPGALLRNHVSWVKALAAKLDNQSSIA